MHSVPPGTGMFLAGHILQRCTQPAPKSLHVLCTVRALAMDGAGLSLSGARPNASGQTPALCEPPARSAPAACPAPSRPEAAGRELEPAGPARRCQSLLALPRTPLASAADPSGGAKKPCLWGSESPNLPLKRPAQSAICWPSLLPRKSILVGAPGLRTPGDIPNPDLMDAYRKENVPPWPGDHLQSGQRLVQKNVSISLSVGDGRDTKTASFQTQSKRTVPTILPGLGPGRRLEVGRPVVSRQLPALVQTNLAPAGQPLQDATSLHWEAAHRPNEQEDPWMEQGLAGNLGTRSQNKSELHPAAGASQLEPPPGETSSTEPLTPEARESRALLSRCFKAWRCHLLGQRAVARALRRRHLLRKGIRAMRWSLWLREAQMEYMKRKQGRTVLATSFLKWKDLYLNRREKKLLTQSKTEAPEKALLPSQEGQQERSFVTLGVVCGVEGAPKIQLHPRWKSGSQSPRAPATRDLQRLAAAFYLWYLQKVLVAEIRKEAQARAELGKKKLRRVFQAWRARTVNTARICTLVTQHQRAQLGRCFGAWMLHTQRKTWCQGKLAHWRVETLRKSLQQWVKMVWLQATHSRTVAQLYLLRQRSWHLEVAVAHEGSCRGPVSQGPGEPDQPCCHPGIRAKDSLEEACRKLKLHRAIWLWSRRLAQHQWADSFSQNRKLRLLQNTLRRWRQKAWVAESPLASSTNSHPEPSVGAQDSEESPPSSGFLSSISAPLGPGTLRSSSEQARSPTESSSSFLSLAGDDSPWVPPLGLSSISSEALEFWRIAFPLGQKWFQLWEWQHPGPGRQLLACHPPGEETGPRIEAVQVPRDPGHLDSPWWKARWQQGSQKDLEAKQHCQSRVICSWNLWAGAQGVWWELVCQQRVWALTQEALHHWHTSWQRQQTLQELGHQWIQHRPYILKRRACAGWPRKASVKRNAACCQEIHFQAWNHMVLTTLNLWVRLWTLQAIWRRTLADLAEVTDRQGQDWRTAVSQIYHARQHRLLRSAWAHWNAVLPRGMPRHQLTKEEEGTSVGPRPRPNAIYPQRLALRGCHILGAASDALGKQATALAQTKRKPHSHTGQRKMSVSLGGPKQSFMLLSSPRLPLHCSSFQPWLPLYRRRGGAEGLTSQEGPRKSTRGQEAGSSRTIQIPKSRAHWRAVVLEETWLERKYLQRWRHEVLLQRFHGQQRKRRLAEVWRCWIDAQGPEQLAQTLVRQRRLEWGWALWRRRWLQLQVALCLQEDRRVLSQAFRKWHQRWAARVPRKGGTSQ
uniref:Uncharacterized protein C1orf167 homolog isoform X2 n=1 Tax=Phascolarctos cinereus TaxID=38626 RepID=A0A6P5JE63_PHACI|nr:uncharacterized protein C1orf167 homolog isoform X2 [Phascolarctos cinereus]